MVSLALNLFSKWLSEKTIDDEKKAKEKEFETEIKGIEEIKGDDGEALMKAKEQCRGRNFEKKGEEFARNIMEEMFRVEFKKRRPDFLKQGEFKKNMELDGYNEKLKVGFEWDGSQHDTYPHAFWKSREEFDAQQMRDMIKDRLCLEEGVILIRIPWNVNRRVIKEFIMREYLKKKSLMSGRK